MSTSQIISGRDVETNEAVWIPGAHEAEQQQFREEVRESVIGKKFAAKFGDPFDPTIVSHLSEVIAKLYGSQIESGTIKYVTSGLYLDALKTLMYSGKLVPIPQEPVATEQTPAQEVPIDRNGRPLTEPQKKWAEYRQFAETHSSRECRERARSDSGFATFMRKNLEREMIGVADGVENLNARPESPSGEITPELRAWVSEYQRTPADKVRQLRRADSNSTGFEEYNKNFDAAITAGLI